MQGEAIIVSTVKTLVSSAQRMVSVEQHLQILNKYFLKLYNLKPKACLVHHGNIQGVYTICSMCGHNLAANFATNSKVISVNLRALTLLPNLAVFKLSSAHC